MSEFGNHRPNLLISLNGGPELFPDDIMQRVSFICAEPITTRTGISIGSILLRGWGRPDYQSGTFSRQRYLDTYPSSIPRVLTDALIVQNARTFFVGKRADHQRSRRPGIFQALVCRSQGKLG
jgi:hypothetical protein